MITVLLYDICVKRNSPISTNILSILLHNWDRDASWGSNVEKPYIPLGILHVWWCKRVMVDYEIISLYDIQSYYSHLVLIGWLCDILIKLSPNKQCHVCQEWMESYTTLLLYSQNWSIITGHYSMTCTVCRWYLMLSQFRSWGFMFKSVVYTNHVISFHEYGHTTPWTITIPGRYKHVLTFHQKIKKSKDFCIMITLYLLLYILQENTI